MPVFTVIPLMAIPLIIYNVIAWGGETFSSAEAVRDKMQEPFQTVSMGSGADWVITPGDCLLALSMCLLFAELLKSTGFGRAAIINHAFSMIIFVICLVEFLMLPAFATSVFFLIMLMALLDTMAGFMVTIATARRDIGFADGGGG